MSFFCCEIVNYLQRGFYYYISLYSIMKCDTIYKTRVSVKDFIMNMKELKKYTKRNLFTRQCIGDALISLMAEHPFEEITTSDICKRAGVSRMTFYHYFYTKTDALNNYIQEIFNSYVQRIEKPVSIERMKTYDHILNSVRFFDRYAPFALLLCKTGQYQILQNAVNMYFEEYVAPNYTGSLYDLYFYSGALLNAYIKWEEKGRKETPEQIAEIVYRMLTP